MEALWKAAVNFGVPAVIAVFLVYFLTNSLSVQLSTIQQRQITLEDQQMSLAEQIRLHTVDNAYVLKETSSMRTLLQQICVNTAEDVVQRANCFKN